MLKRGKKANSQERINIDYPKSAEAVFSPHYAVRITAAPCETVEVSVDGGPYASCHNSAGHWWYHLNGLTEGAHKLAARVKISGETAFALRKFEVQKSR
ncbi:MAG TPA: hypothetical protein DCZ93_12790 [Elusimicrobia bacterium]|jgi:hypothetical protein|nr:hypothetical protein [Elusimicrobiota bacterium]